MRKNECKKESRRMRMGMQGAGYWQYVSLHSFQIQSIISIINIILDDHSTVHPPFPPFIRQRVLTLLPLVRQTL